MAEPCIALTLLHEFLPCAQSFVSGYEYILVPKGVVCRIFHVEIVRRGRGNLFSSLTSLTGLHTLPH